MIIFKPLLYRSILTARHNITDDPKSIVDALIISRTCGFTAPLGLISDVMGYEAWYPYPIEFCPKCAGVSPQGHRSRVYMHCLKKIHIKYLVNKLGIDHPYILSELTSFVRGVEFIDRLKYWTTPVYLRS